MASVFLSYDRDDSDRARRFARALEKAGHQVWWDLHVRGGAQFSKVIEEALKAADVVVVLWSAHAIESAWVRDEAGAGRDTGRLVPVTIDGTQAPLGFRQLQTIDLSSWNGRRVSSEFRALLADVESTAAARISADPQPFESAAAVPGVRRDPPRPQKAFLLASGALLLLLLVAGGLYWKLPRHDAGAPTVGVIAADASPLSQSMAHNVLVNIGSVAGSSTPSFRLLDEASRARPDLRLTVNGVQQGSGTQATVALASSRQEGILWSKQIQEPATERSSLEQAAAYAALGAISCAADDSNGESRRLSASDLRAYLNACVSRDESDDLQSLIATFRKTTEAAPHLAAAWANLLIVEADAFRNARSLGEPTDKIESSMRRDIASARKLRPDLAEAILAEVSLQPPTAFLTSVSLMDRAVAAHPDNVDVLSERAVQLSMVGRMDDAFADHARAAELKPYSATLRGDYIAALASSGGVAKARSDLADAKKLWPDSFRIASTEVNFNLRYGDFEKTWRAAGMPIDGGIIGYFNILHDPTDANIDAWINLAKTHEMLQPHRLFILQALGPLKRVDQLYEFLDKWPIDKDLQGNTYLLFRPWMANVRRDPRFMRLAQRVGLLSYWQESGKWPDFCAEPDMPYDCKKEAAKLKA